MTAARETPHTPHTAVVVAVVALGGGVGSLARYVVGAALGPLAGDPWATYTANVSGALLLGVLVVLAGEVWPHRPLLRPALGTGLLGGYTTFAVHAHEAVDLLAAAAYLPAAAYLGGTALTAVAAAALGAGLATAAVRVAHRRTGR